MDIIEICYELKRIFMEAVRRNSAEGILLSGGLDSSLGAACSQNSMAISIGLESYGDDRDYADTVARYLNLEHFLVTVTIDDAVKTIPEVIRITRSFDPIVPNDVVVYLGLKRARDMGIRSVMTGDGSDEIFAGYDFMLTMEDLDQYMALMHSTMNFSSNTMGEVFGIDIRQPFLDDEFVSFSKEIPLNLKIRKENGQIWGKWILRKTFSGILPHEILWQKKRPLEYGSGMTELRRIITSRISDKEFQEGKESFPIRFWNKEHFYYYRIYRQVVGEIPAPTKGEKTCDCCGTGVHRNTFHCRICGNVTEWKKLGNM